MRQREDDMMVADRKQFVLTRCEPLVAGVRQTLRTVSIPARVVRDGAMIAAHAAIEMAAQRRGAAAREGAEYSPVLAGQPAPCVSMKRSPCCRMISATSKGGRVTASA